MNTQTTYQALNFCRSATLPAVLLGVTAVTFLIGVISYFVIGEKALPSLASTIFLSLMYIDTMVNQFDQNEFLRTVPNLRKRVRQVCVSLVALPLGISIGMLGITSFVVIYICGVFCLARLVEHISLTKVTWLPTLLRILPVILPYHYTTIDPLLWSPLMIIFSILLGVLYARPTQWNKQSAEIIEKSISLQENNYIAVAANYISLGKKKAHDITLYVPITSIILFCLLVAITWVIFGVTRFISPSNMLNPFIFIYLFCIVFGIIASFTILLSKEVAGWYSLRPQQGELQQVKRHLLKQAVVKFSIFSLVATSSMLITEVIIFRNISGSYWRI